MDDDDDIAAAVAAGRRAKADALASSHNEDVLPDNELQSSMYNDLKQKYDDMLSQYREQEKTINF